MELEHISSMDFGSVWFGSSIFFSKTKNWSEWLGGKGGEFTVGLSASTEF